MPDGLAKLEQWYAAQCAESARTGSRWEHHYGITIGTSDNPAWNVGIDLTGTPLDGVTFEAVNIDNGDDDWLIMHVLENQFNGIGDPSKLQVILGRFLELVDASS